MPLPPCPPARAALLTLALWLAGLSPAAAAEGAPRAALVMDGRTGEVLLAQNADARLHPASLTKMMTLYLAFRAAERGEIDLAAETVVSARAAGEPGSGLGLRAGERVTLRDLVRAVAVGSANDAATALAEAIAGDEAAFVARMNRAAAAMGLEATSFRNAHGLTEAGHRSSARDMARLGRRLRFDFPSRWALFSRLSAEAAGRRMAHTNRRFLTGYGGADGIKTGYTRAAGYTLTASAERGETWVIATVFGAPSSAARAARAARLIDAAFARLPERVAAVPPAPLRDPEAAPPRRASGLMSGVRPLRESRRRPLSGAPAETARGAGGPRAIPAGGVALSALRGAAAVVPPGAAASPLARHGDGGP